MEEARRPITAQDGILAAGAELLRFEGLTLDFAGRTLSGADGREIPLTRAEFLLLSALIRSRGRAFSRDQLLDAVAGRRAEPFDRSVDVLIGRLRRKIEPEPKAPRLILTVQGHGYKFAAKPLPLIEQQQAPAAPQIAAEEPSTTLATPTAERRQLSVLFCVLVGSIELAARLDPEDFGTLQAAYQRLVAEAVARCDGFIAKYLGDGLLVYFGWPRASEANAEQALHAALAVAEAVALAPIGGEALRVRIGVATGLVVVGDRVRIGEAWEQTTIGETPNRAARLQALAEPGRIVIDDATRRLVGGLFDIRAMGAVSLRGLPRPVEVFEVRGERADESRFDALHATGLTPLVGRGEESTVLLQRWHRVQSGSGNAVLLSGEPGIGKSRVVRELRNWLADTANMQLIFSCAPHQRDSPYYPFIQHLQHAAGFARLDGAAARLGKLKALLAKTGGDEQGFALLADLLSIPSDGSSVKLNLSPRQRRERTAAALIGQVVAAAACAPVLLVFEDVQWMDQTSLEVLDALVDRVADLPALLIITFRPEFTAPWSSHHHTTVLVLNRLDHGAAAQMVAQISGGAMPESLSQRIIARADGVPLFLEELTKTMLEGGAEAGTSLPATLHDSLMERLDRLPAAKHMAQLGAAIGRSFAHELIAALSDVPEKALCSALDQLVSSGLVARRGLPPDATYTFKHALVQTAAHESMLKSRRTAIHERIVELLLTQEPDIEDLQPDLLAYHCELAGLAEKAAGYYIEAGWKSDSHGAYEDSREQVRNALRVAATMPEGKARDLAELRALRGLGLTIGNIEGYASANFNAPYLRALELCDRIGQPPEFLGVNFGISTFQHMRSDLSGLLQTAKRLSRWGQLRGDIRGSILGELMAGKARSACGALASARLHLQRALELSERSQDDPAVIWTYKVVVSRAIVMYNIHSFLSRVLCWMGYPEQALTHSSAVEEQREEEVRIVMEPLRLWYRLWVLPALGEGQDLVATAEKMAELSRHHNLPMFAAVAAIMRGYGSARNGQPEAGQLLISDGLAAYTATGAVRDSCYYRALLAETHTMIGEADAALSILSAALEETERTGEKCYDAELHRGIGEAYYQRGDTQAAEQSFRQALTVAHEQGARLWELNAATSYARMLRDQGEPRQAHARLSPIYSWFSEGFDTVPLRRARALLDELEVADNVATP
jgi:class 3 adenylate cyclase/tetratricopeptide (TPR) repeat protein